MPRLAPRLAPLLLFALAAPALAQAPLAWQELPASPYNSYRSEDVSFVGARGWAVTGAGRAYRTDDGGASWRPPVQLNGYLRATGFATPETGWIGVLFSPTQLYETRDGGLSYTDVTDRITPAVAGGICGIWVQDAQTVWAAGQYSSPAYIVKTEDGGATWTSRAMAPLVDELIDIRFFDSQHGLATGGTGPYGDSRARIIGTDDGGETWTERYTVPPGGPWSVAWKLTFPTRMVGYASVEQLAQPQDGLVLKTVDGGQTWQPITIPGGRSLQGLGFLTPEVGWASGRGQTTMTTDGGLTWAPLQPTRSGLRNNPDGPLIPGGQLDGDVNRFRFVGDSLAYAAGHRIYRLDVPRPVAAEALPGGADGLASVSPNPSRGSVQVAYRVAEAGTVRVSVFDVRGRRVASLLSGTAAPGNHVATWDVGDVAPGLYVVRMQSERGVWTRAVSVVR